MVHVINLIFFDVLAKIMFPLPSADQIAAFKDVTLDKLSAAAPPSAASAPPPPPPSSSTPPAAPGSSYPSHMKVSGLRMYWLNWGI